MQVMASYQQAENAPFSPRPSPSGRAGYYDYRGDIPNAIDRWELYKYCQRNGITPYAKNARSLAERLNLGTTAIEGV